LKLQGKAAVITGGASGIGEAIARTFAREGASVHVVDIHPENARRVAGEVKGTAHVCDVSDEAAAGAVFAAVPRIDILVNSVGMAHVGTVETTSAATFDQVLRVNVRSFYIAIRQAVEKMKTHGGGVIVNLASIAASSGLADRFAYSTSKGAVLAMTYSVARDCLKHNIRCNAISPARVHTPFVDGFVRKNYPGHEAEAYQRLSASQPIGRMARPDEVAQLALFLCSDESAFITGTDYPIDGGFFNLHG
jgi:NAD(P)-dependent dehydrogenase (short-subunit alcohol dehydrogenase family)